MVSSGEPCQYHFAMEDARRLVELEPTGWTGHHRAAEIQLLTHNYQVAEAAAS
jgi:hypothetical protein